MTLKEYTTRPKIISLIMIFCLVVFCFIVARIGMRRIIEPDTPLSSINIEAMFYVEMPDNGQIVCIGDGLINSPDEKSGEIAVERSVVTAPDNSAFVGNSYHVVWNNIRHGENGIEVYGKAESGPKPEKKVVTSVRDFGAVGDGVTDDSAAFQTAFKKVKSEAVLYIPSGTYVLGNTIYVPSGINIVGDSNNTTLLIAKEGTPIGKSVVRINDANNVTITNISISGNSAVNYENMNSSRGIFLLDIWNSNNVTIQNCKFIDNINCAVRDIGSSNVTVDNCYFKDVDCGFITLGSTDVSNLQVTNNVFIGHKSSEPVSLYAEARHSHVLIENNQMSNKTYGGAILVRGFKPNDDITIRNNTINACAAGITLENTTNFQVLNNTITSTTSGTGIQLIKCVSGVFDNNSCSNASQDGLLVKDCNNITLSRVSIIDCGQKNGNYFNIRFTGSSNNNIVFTDSKSVYNNKNDIGICFDCYTDIAMDDFTHKNSTIWLSKNSTNLNLDIPSSVKVKDSGVSNKLTKY